MRRGQGDLEGLVHLVDVVVEGLDLVGLAAVGRRAHGEVHRHEAAIELAGVRVDDRQHGDRTVFGQPVAAFQNTKFELAACKAEVDAAQAVVDRALEAHDAGELTPAPSHQPARREGVAALRAGAVVGFASAKCTIWAYDWLEQKLIKKRNMAVVPQVGPGNYGVSVMIGL